jgi:hypothetical protein
VLTAQLTIKQPDDLVTFLQLIEYINTQKVRRAYITIPFCIFLTRIAQHHHNNLTIKLVKRAFLSSEVPIDILLYDQYLTTTNSQRVAYSSAARSQQYNLVHVHTIAWDRVWTEHIHKIASQYEFDRMLVMQSTSEPTARSCLLHPHCYLGNFWWDIEENKPEVEELPECTKPTRILPILAFGEIDLDSRSTKDIFCEVKNKLERTPNVKLVAPIRILATHITSAWTPREVTKYALSGDITSGLDATTSTLVSRRESQSVTIISGFPGESK